LENTGIFQLENWYRMAVATNEPFPEDGLVKICSSIILIATASKFS
jgi:hypothetical protein